MKIRAKKKESKKEKINPKEVLKQKKSYADSLQDELELKGVVFFEPKPREDGGTLNINSEYLVLPRDITEISSIDLGEYLNAYTQQKVYMRTLLGWAEMYFEEAKNEYTHASSSKYTQMSGSKLSEKSKDREINSDPDIVPYYENLIDKQNSCRLLQITIDNIEDIIFLLSREVSRRTGDFSNDKRNYNVNRN